MYAYNGTTQSPISGDMYFLGVPADHNKPSLPSPIPASPPLSRA